MSFLHPWAIWLGLAGAMAPVLVHFLTRPRPQRVPSSTVRFLRQAVEQRRSRRNLRDFLLLLLRTLAILAFAFAIARPQWGEETLLVDAEDASLYRVVLVDASASMLANEGGTRLIERAKSKAAEYLDYQPGLKVALVVAAAQPQSAFEGVSANFEVLRETLGGAKARQESLNTRAAIEEAARMLQTAAGQAGAEEAKNLELVIVSDFQRTSWASADFSVLPKETKIQLEAVATPKVPGNLAITGVSLENHNAAERTADLVVQVGNYSDAPRQVKVEIRSELGTWYLEGLATPGRETSLRSNVKLPAEGWKAATARLLATNDALPEDDLRYFVLGASRPPRFGIVRTEKEGAAKRMLANASPSRLPGSFFLEQALRFVSETDANAEPDASVATKTSTDEPEVVEYFDPASPNPARMGRCDILFVCKPGKLSADALGVLATHLEQGRSVCYIASEAVDATNLRQLLDAVPDATLPVEFLPRARGSSTARRGGEFYKLKNIRDDELPFRAFGENLATLREQLRFAPTSLSSQRSGHGVLREILAQYDDADATAALVATSVGKGRLAVWNVELDRSNLVHSQFFVPLVAELVARLTQGRDQTRQNNCGQPLVVRLPAEVITGANAKMRRAGVTGEAKEKEAGEETEQESDFGSLRDERNGVVWSWNAPVQTGVFEVVRGEKSLYSVAVNQPASESQLDRLPESVFTERLAGERELFYHGVVGGRPEREEAWKYLAIFCLLCIFGEWGILLATKS